jgi:ankyrin repeat protein
MSSLSGMFNQNSSGMTAVEYAERHGHKDTVEQLLRHGAKPVAATKPRDVGMKTEDKRGIRIMRPLSLKRRTKGQTGGAG